MNRISNDFKHTRYACYLGLVTQAITINFAPLLFLTFQREFNIPLEQITLLITITFLIQLTVDFLSINVVKAIGHRKAAIFAHIFACLGLVLLSFLPSIMVHKFLALLICVIIYSVGAGLIEVLASPIAEACPSDNKSASMSILHSFYCWGQMGVIIISTLFFVCFGTQSWRILSIIWAIVPFVNIFYFAKVPINKLAGDEENISLKEMFSNKLMWIFVIMMICGGAAELGMSQWASTFAESGLKVSKTIGDLAGPCLFALFMGLSRVLYSKFSAKLSLQNCMIFSAVLCCTCYLVCWLSPNAFLSLFACAVCGFSVGILWPGTFSLAMEKSTNGSMSMFAILALAGDLGCSLGPTIIGLASSKMDSNIKQGMGMGMIFPIILIIAVLICIKLTRKPR